jgi:hypothetical protein
MESNKERREEYIEAIKVITRDKLVYIDESGIEEAISKTHGLGRKGRVLHGRKSGKYYRRTNIIAG